MPTKKLFRNPAESYSVVLAAVIYFYALYYQFIFPFPPMVVACGVGGTIMLLTIPIERFFNKPVLTSNFMISVGYLLIAYSASTLDGKYGSGILYVAIGPLLAGFSQTRYVVFWCVAAIGLYFGINFADTNGWIEPYRLTPEVRSHFALTDAIGITLIISSITTIFARTRKRQFEDIQQKHSQIETLVRVIAHDIANPLNLISFSMGRAAKRGLDEELQKRVKKGITSIQAIIQQTKNLQALEAGKIAINLQNGVCLRELIQQSIEVFEDQLTKKDLQVSYEFVDANVKVCVDPQIFQTQILNNLLSNAIKFSHEHGKIEFNVDPQSKSNNKIDLIISDHGTGMPEDTLSSLFRIAKIHSQTGTQGETGTGFGLSIVKKYLEQMNGSIEIQSVYAPSESSQTSGTTIKVSLAKAS